MLLSYVLEKLFVKNHAKHTSETASKVAQAHDAAKHTPKHTAKHTLIPRPVVGCFSSLQDVAKQFKPCICPSALLTPTAQERV